MLAHAAQQCCDTDLEPQSQNLSQAEELPTIDAGDATTSGLTTNDTQYNNSVTRCAL